jgi:hypothetical protein
VALRVVEFLTDEGLARSSPRAALEQWLTRRLAALPAPFAAEVRIWTEALHGRGPRAARPRHPRTIEAYLRVLATPLAEWADRYGSLRQVTTEDLAAQLALLTGATRRLAMAAMRSLFTTLKARRVLFSNPAAPLTGRAVQPPPVLPLDDTLRARLLGSLAEPGQRLIVLLAGVHALRPSQICALTLDAADPAASALLISGRARPLDRLTAGHLRAWLQARHQRWPATANPHLLINRSTAGGVKPVSRGYVQDTVRRAGIRRRAARRPAAERSPRHRRRPAPAHPPVRDQRSHRHPLLRRNRGTRPPLFTRPHPRRPVGSEGGRPASACRRVRPGVAGPVC